MRFNLIPKKSDVVEGSRPLDSLTRFRKNKIEAMRERQTHLTV